MYICLFSLKCLYLKTGAAKGRVLLWSCSSVSGTVFSPLSSMLMSRKPKLCCSPLRSVWMLNDSYYRWTAALYMWSVRRLVLSALTSDGGPTLLPDSEVGRQLCPFSLCRAARRRAAQLNAAGLEWFGLNSCWHAETQLSLRSDAFTARHQQRKGGRKTEDEQKARLIPSMSSYPSHCQMVHFSPQFPAYHFL